MKRLAGVLILSLLLQIVAPMTVYATVGEAEKNDQTLDMMFKDGYDEEPDETKNVDIAELEENQLDTNSANIVNVDTVSVDTVNVVEVEGFFQEKYYKGENGYSLFVGVAMPEWNSSTKVLTNVAYQLDDGKLTVLGTVSSDKFRYYKPTWADDYGGCLTISLDSIPVEADEGVHSLVVYFTVSGVEYKVEGTSELVNEWSDGEGKVWNQGDTEYISLRKGSPIWKIDVTGYTSRKNEKYTKLQLVSPTTGDIALSVPVSGYSSARRCRCSSFFTGQGGLRYSLSTEVIPIEYEINADIWNIEIEKDIEEGYYDILVFTSTGRKYRAQNAYYATNRPIVCGVRVENGTAYIPFGINDGNNKFFSDNTGNYISVFVYGYNLDKDNIPTFYHFSSNEILASYDAADQECGYEYGNICGNFYRLKKTSAEIGNHTSSHVKVNGDVLYSYGGDYCYAEISSKGIFFEEHLESGQLYDGSEGRVRLYIGEGVECSEGDSVIYEMKTYSDTSDYGATITDTAVVQKNKNGKYIEFSEKSQIYKRINNRASFKLIKGSEVLTVESAYRSWYNIDIQSANYLQVPAGCSWEIHAIGEITKTLYSGINTSNSTSSVLTSSQIFDLAKQGTVRVCIYNSDGTVRERKLVCFYSDLDQPMFPISVGYLNASQIKVVDSKGLPIAGAEVLYRGSVLLTSENGIATLLDYEPGNSLCINKQNYITKTIDSFVGNATGCTTYVLLSSGGILQSARMIVNGEGTDILTKEATINRYYKTTNFSIHCKTRSGYDTYELYSGERRIAESEKGAFDNLRYDSFTAGEVVYLCISGERVETVKVKLGLQVVDLDPKVYEFSIGDSISVKAPNNIPIIGGKELKIDLGTLPVECKLSLDNKFQIGINAGELIKKDKDWFSTLKKMNKDNFPKYLIEAYKGKEDKGKYQAKVDEINSDFKVMGWLEGTITDSSKLEGKLLVEFSLSYSKENQFSIFGVPVVVEISVSGKVNADGSISFTAEEGFTSGKLSVGGEIGAGLYAGVGLANVVSAGVYGDAAVGLKYDIFPVAVRGLNEFYVKGDAGIKAKVFGKDIGEWELIEGTYYIIHNDTNTEPFSDNQTGVSSFTIDNDRVYENTSRDYLNADGTIPYWTSDSQSYTDGNTNETMLQNAICLDIIPKVIRVKDTAMLFYLADAGMECAAADRSRLVYSIWDKENENWSEPQAVLEDGTADFAPDIYTDGEKLYVVWQNAEESLAGDLTLNDIANRLVLHVAVYDEHQNQFLDLGTVESKNNLFQQKPQIVAEGDKISVYWYENEQDNVLGLSGTNRVYQAVLKETTEFLNENEESVSESIELEMQTSDLGEEESSQENLDEKESEEAETEQSEVESPNIDESGTIDAAIISSSSLGSDVEVQGVIETELSEYDTENPTVEESTFDETETYVEEDEVLDDNEIESTERQTQEEDTTEEETLESDQTEGFDLEEPEVFVENSAYETVTTEGAKWEITFQQEEKECIISADAGRMNDKITYAYIAGTLDDQYKVTQSKVILLEQGESAEILAAGIYENTQFLSIFGTDTLTWYQNGEIYYMDMNNNIAALFGESRLPSSVYTVLSDSAGSLEVIFPVNVGGKSNLYRISYEDGIFHAALPITDQEDYIQYADGFVSNDKTVLVYNKMEVNENLEEVNNSLCTGTVSHSYYDIAVQHAGSTVRKDADTGENILEISAQIYNNGTMRAEELSLSLSRADGTVLETVPIDIVLESGESGYGTAFFSIDNITEKADFIVSVSGAAENNIDNNSTIITIGESALQVEAEVIAVADTRMIQIGIENTGMEKCGGTVSVCDAETGEEYGSASFEPIVRGRTAFAEIDIDENVFEQKDVLLLEIIVAPEDGKEAVSDFVTVYAPTYIVNFVTETEEYTMYVEYGQKTNFPKNPSKEGEYFIGWYNTKNLEGGTLYTEETLIKEDVTLYARFAKEAGTIHMENCSVTEIPTQLYTGKVIKPTVTVKWGNEVLKAKKDYTVSYQNNKKQGKATVIITGKGKYSGSIMRNFMIMYPINKSSVKAIPTVNFTGENHTPDVTVTYNKKKLVKNRDYTVAYTNNCNAGTAGVTITGKGTYTGTKTVTFTIKGTNIKEMIFEKLQAVTYNGNDITPVITVKDKNGKQLRAGADYKVVYTNAINKGTASVTVIGNGNYIGTKKLTYKILAKPLDESMISVVGETTYTGSAIRPKILITDSDRELIQNKDYTLFYSNNKVVGTAVITVKGKGNYSGTVKTSFNIQAVNLENNPQICVKVNDMAYTGKALKPKVQVYEGDKKLPASAYKISYKNNVEKGNATVIITGKGNYSGTISANFRIVDKAKLITSLKIDKIMDMTYTGSAVEPEVIVMDGDYQLIKGVDYETIYSNQYNAGKAKVTITGIGSYAGSKDVKYKINKRVIADKNILEEGFTIKKIPNEKYTGYALKPDIIIKDNEKILTLGKDYKLSYKKNTKIGTAMVTVSGIGNYSGSINTVSFEIVSWNYDDLQVEISDQIYTGKALKPEVVFYTNGEAVKLKPKTAVKIAYANNKNVGTATVTITGQGELRNMKPIKTTFVIEPADLENAVVNRIPNQTLKGFSVKPIPKIKVGKNTLKADRDYTISYLRNGVKGEAEMIITGIGNYKGECRKTFIVQ